MLVPDAAPGTVDPRAAQLVQPRWSRARRLLLTAFAGLPAGIVLLCACSVVVAGAMAGFDWWLPLPVAGSAIPALVLLGVVRGLVSEPPRWPKVVFLAGGCQLLFGVFPAVGIAASAGGGAAAVAVVALALSLVAIGLGVASVVKAARVLLTPVSAELGATSFTVAVSARLVDTGLMAGSIAVTRNSVEWSVRQHRATGRAALPFAGLRGARPVTAQSIPWLRLSDGSVAQTAPGPAVALSTDSGELLLPVPDPPVFLALLEARVADWRRANRT